MRNLVVALTLILSLNAFAQNEFEDKKIFVRVYDMEGKKIRKGKIVSISETYLYFLDKRDTLQIFVTRIGKIKTKRSAGHNIFTGAAIGGGFFAILGAASADNNDNQSGWPTIIPSYSAGTGFAGGLLIGGSAGAIVGGLTTPFKNSKSYDINGEIEKLKAFKEAMLNK